MSRLAIAAALLFSLLATPRAEACRGPFPPLEENVKRAAEIFVGTVREVRELDDAFIMVFDVEESLKGSAGKTVEVRGPKHTCGYGFGVKKGARLLIFAGGTPLGTSAVSGNRNNPDGELLGQVRGLLSAAKK